MVFFFRLCSCSLCCAVLRSESNWSEWREVSFYVELFKINESRTFFFQFRIMAAHDLRLSLLLCKVVDRGRKKKTRKRERKKSWRKKKKIETITSLFFVYFPATWSASLKTNFILVEMSLKVGKWQQQLLIRQFFHSANKANTHIYTKMRKELSRKWKLWNRVCHYSMLSAVILLLFSFSSFSLLSPFALLDV